MARGRPSLFTQQLADEICERLARGESLNAICETDSFPSEGTVRLWALNDVEGFATKYARARDLQADFYAEEIIQLSDKTRLGVKTEESEGEDGVSKTKTITGDMVERTRLQIDARKWFAARVAPKKYGDRQALEHSGPGGVPLSIKVTGVDGVDD